MTSTLARMDSFFPLFAIAGALTLGAMSPGPSFVMVARTAVARSRANGLAAALGMGVGGATYATASLLGLQALFAAVPVVYLLIKVGGGIYLIYIGVRIWGNSKQALLVSADDGRSAPERPQRSFALALITQLSNPKAAVVYGSIFAAFMPRYVPIAFGVSIPVVCFVIETGWYSTVASLLSSSRPRAAYLGFKSQFDRIAGSVMMLLGSKLIASAHEA
ncbi:MAG: LysE family translocator [Steroidobacteraceae bacterium]